jgi:hypothetical protein
MEEREKVVCLAKLAEQAERYDGKGSHLLVAPCLMLVCSAVVPGALHYGEIRALFFVGKELGVVGLRSGALASVLAYFLRGLNSNLPAAAAIFLGGFFRAGAKFL